MRTERRDKDEMIEKAYENEEKEQGRGNENTR
jgi:hypothetical protein